MTWLFSANFSEILDCNFAWQAQYLVRLEGDACCSAHCKWRFICDGHQSCKSFYAAGAVFGAVGGWVLLLCALQMTFDMSWRSMMWVILRSRRSIWWGWRVSPVALRIENDVWYVMDQWCESFFLAGKVLGDVAVDDTCCSAHCKCRFLCDDD